MAAALLAGLTAGSVNAAELETDEVGFVNPASGRWVLGGGEDFFFGVPGDIPFLGDWNGDGADTPGLYRPSSGFAYIRNSRDTGEADHSWFMGVPGDVPIVGDWDGDGIDTFSVYRPSVSTVFISNQNDTAVADADYLFGVRGDRPFGGDFNGDDVDEVGLHRQSNGFVYYRLDQTSGFADNEFFWGIRNDRVFAGDWTGDGVDTPGLVRPSSSTLFFRWSNSLGSADASRAVPNPDWAPVVGRIPGSRVITTREYPVELVGINGGSGLFTLEVTTNGDVCYELSLSGLTGVASLAVHTGAAGSDGPELLDLDYPRNGTAGCVTAGPTTADEIIAAPDGHYVLLSDSTGALLAREQLAEARSWDLELVGANVRPLNTGDSDGFVALTLKALTTGEVCVLAYDQERIGEVSSVGVYEGGFGANGSLVADLTLGPGRLGCTPTDPDVVALQLIARPSDFYVQIDTATFPAGAVRAQLFIGPP